MTGDFNSDGAADLVATNAVDGTLARWWGDGAGGFTYAGTWGPGWNGYNNFTAAVITGDGKVDLVAVSATDGALARWSGNGAGGFTFIP